MKMNHNIGCRKGQTQYEIPQVMAGGHPAAPITVQHDGSCTCGLEALQHRAERAEALIKYAEHKKSCHIVRHELTGTARDQLANCSCGLNEARKALEDK